MPWNCDQCGEKNIGDQYRTCPYCGRGINPKAGIQPAQLRLEEKAERAAEKEIKKIRAIVPPYPTYAPPAAAPAYPAAAPPGAKKPAPDSIGDRVAYWILSVILFAAAAVVLRIVSFDRLVIIIVLTVIGSIWLVMDYHLKAAAMLQYGFGGPVGGRAARWAFRRAAGR